MLSINHVTLFEPFDSVVCLLIFYLNEGLNISPAEKSTSTRTDATFWELSRELFGVAAYYNGVAIHFSEQKKHTLVKTSDVTSGWAVMYAGNAVVALGWIHSFMNGSGTAVSSLLKVIHVLHLLEVIVPLDSSRLNI